ncbi:myo-inositol 2-dehydrogenase-like [Ylistrum balloti]|uniref:myo-inositol 2-dehydrogenase-like n=1 Tax=Ylistrum balloti TaxID=509963 RepID=UPI002905BFA2|nr:myo-inositol 2-dehydrogenase-like [Ylistrum balloti]
MTSNKVGLALLGLGRIGQVHLKIILSSEQANLLWVMEENIKIAEMVMKEHKMLGKIRVASSDQFDDILLDTSVQGIFVCTPTDTHTALVRKALTARKAVFCEKPLSEELADIQACYDDAEKYGATLFCAFNRHFDFGIRSMYEKARSGGLGKIYMVKTTFHDTPLWMGAPSLSQTFLIHDVDLLCWFADALPDTVVVQATANIKEAAEKCDVDTVGILMRFPCGMLGILDFCRYSPYGYDVRLEVSGSAGMEVTDAKPLSLVKTYTPSYQGAAQIHATFPERFHQAYTSEQEHFLDVIQGKAELEVKRVFSERAAKVIDAIKESYKTGQVITLKK